MVRGGYLKELSKHRVSDACFNVGVLSHLVVGWLDGLEASGMAGGNAAERGLRCQEGGHPRVELMGCGG